MGLGWNKVAPSPLQGPAGSPRTSALVGSGPDSADLLPVAAPTRRQRRRARLSAFQPLSLAGFLPSHLALAHFRNKGKAGTSPLPGGAYYLILYPSITTSCGGIIPGVPALLPVPRLLGVFVVVVPIHSGKPSEGQAGP